MEYRGQKECFGGGAAIQITNFKGPGILPSTLGWLEAGQNFQGILSLEGFIPDTPPSSTRSAKYSSPTFQEGKCSRRLSTMSSLVQSPEVGRMSKSDQCLVGPFRCKAC